MTVHDPSIASDARSDYFSVQSHMRLEAGARRLARDRFKRAMDVVGASVGLAVLSPLLLLIAVIIRLESRGWPVFCQRRSGLGGRAFVIYKFRSMRVCEDGDEIRQASREDARMTRFGSFLRRTSIDELPQLLNILKGDMSIVGPRPHALAHDALYGSLVPDYDSRFLTKPGLTGLAQVSGLRGRTENVRDMAARVMKDLEYIERWSVSLDVQIILRTVLIFAFHPKAY
jgi:putative colanic acid biosysnthesis UDP-glucose lipid carrier transferase